MNHARERYNARRANIDGTYRHQVALPAYMCTRENLPVLQDFCLDRFGALCPTRNVTTIWADGHEECYRLHCFETQTDAERFALHFDGEHFDPLKDRDNGKVEGAWKRPTAWVLITRCGPLELPDFWRLNP